MLCTSQHTLEKVNTSTLRRQYHSSSTLPRPMHRHTGSNKQTSAHSLPKIPGDATPAGAAVPLLQLQTPQQTCLTQAQLEVLQLHRVGFAVSGKLDRPGGDPFDVVLGQRQQQLRRKAGGERSSGQSAQSQRSRGRRRTFAVVSHGRPYGRLKNMNFEPEEIVCVRGHGSQLEGGGRGGSDPSVSYKPTGTIWRGLVRRKGPIG